MSDPAIAITTMNHDFGGPPILRSVDLTIPRGTIFGVLGRNGGGKTTLIRMLLGMIRPRAGQCRVLGLDPARDALAIRRQVGYVPQESDIDPWMRVGEALDFVAGFYPERWLADQLVVWLDRFELDRRQPVSELSGGQLGRL
ncbi:MAG: ABC transporter ATP-binding protein, partial [Acidobacteriota bacterium]